MQRDGSWTIAAPTKDELIEVFISKSVWYSKVRKFAQLVAGSALHKWLEGAADAPAGSIVFGVGKDSYNFDDLSRVLKGAEGGDKKGKGRAVVEKEAGKEKGKGKGEGKGKGKGEGKGKGKGKKVTE
jgi:hypothetical protein